MPLPRFSLRLPSEFGFAKVYSPAPSAEELLGSPSEIPPFILRAIPFFLLTISLPPSFSPVLPSRFTTLLWNGLEMVELTGGRASGT